jgi:hypothetical protein
VVGWLNRNSPSKIGAIKNGEPKVVKNLLIQVKDTFLLLQLKVLARLSTLLQLVQSVLAKKPGSNS